jgi:hypothetical protein
MHGQPRIPGTSAPVVPSRAIQLCELQPSFRLALTNDLIGDLDIGEGFLLIVRTADLIGRHCFVEPAMPEGIVQFMESAVSTL